MNKNDLLKCLLNKINDICYISNKYGKENVNGKKYHTLLNILQKITKKFTIKLKEKVNHKTRVHNKMRKHAKNKKIHKKEDDKKQEVGKNTNEEDVKNFEDFLCINNKDEKKIPSYTTEYIHPSMSDNKVIFGTDSEYANNIDNFTQQTELKGQDAIDMEIWDNKNAPKHKRMRAFARIMKSKNIPQVLKQAIMDEKDEENEQSRMNARISKEQEQEIIKIENTMLKGNNEIKTTNDFTQIIPKKEEKKKKKKKKQQTVIEEYIEYLKQEKEKEKKEKENNESQLEQFKENSSTTSQLDNLEMNEYMMKMQELRAGILNAQSVQNKDDNNL